MAYIRAKGGAAFGPFHGFGADAGVTGQPIIDKQIDVGVSKILDTVAAGIDTKHLPDALKRAQQLSAKYIPGVKDVTKRKMLEFFYLQARSGLTGILKNDQAQAVSRAIGDAASIAGNVRSIVDKFKTDEPIDASGITDIAGISHKITGSIVGFLTRVGALDSKTSADVMAWSNVAVGCAAAVGSIGPYAGAASCALQFANLLIDMLSRKTPKPDDQAAIFVPTKEQVFLASADAIRLASILRYQYGIKTWDDVYKNQILPSDPDDPTAKYLKKQDYPTLEEKRPMTGIDMRVALAVMRFNGIDAGGNVQQTTLLPQELRSLMGNVDQHGDGNPWLSTRHMLYMIGKNEWAGDSGRGTYDRDIYNTYIWDHDVDVQCIDYGAKLYKKYPQVARAGGLDAFKRVYELINFFSALTIRELKTKQQMIYVYTAPTSRLPVRLYAVADDGGTDCRDDFYDEECQSRKYGKQCWTSLNRCNIPTNRCWAETPPYGLHARMLQGDMCAIRQVGAIRLMAAFSFLHMAYVRGVEMGKALPSQDLLRSLPNTDDPAVTTQVPVKVTDFQWVTTLESRMKAAADEADKLKKIAIAAARQDHDQIQMMDQKLVEQFKAAAQSPALKSAMTSSSNIMDMIKSGQLELSTMLETRQKCLSAGGAWMENGADCDTDSAGNLINCKPATSSTIKKYYCVPQGTPGSSGISASGELKGPSIGTILTVAGAGLLLMRLLKA